MQSFNNKFSYGVPGFKNGNVWIDPIVTSKILTVEQLNKMLEYMKDLNSYFVSKSGLPSKESQRINSESNATVCFKYDEETVSSAEFNRVAITVLMMYIGINIEPTLYRAISCIEVKKDRKYIRFWLNNASKDRKLIELMEKSVGKFSETFTHEF